MLRTFCPEMVPHRWQAELLLQLGGFLDPNDLSKRTDITDQLPFKLNLAAANGSGKDQFIIAAFLVWFALVGTRNRGIVTSASHNQLKSQTAPGILYIINAINKKLPGTFKVVEFHYFCTITASEIRLFATDEEGKAEGYHPWHGGKMAIVINEAKTVKMFGALRRCSGYAYWLEVSSPGVKSGDFYQSYLNSICYPAPVKLGYYWHRRISAYDCPHISPHEIEQNRLTMEPEWFKSSVLAEFSDIGEQIVITDTMILEIGTPLPTHDEEIAIGLDLAAGGDEDSCYVRRGRDIIHQFHFKQRDTTLAADMIDTELAPYRNLNYVFNADDGGVGHAILDMLVRKGWRINRMNNQSPASDKREYLNLGAQMWFWLRRLIIHKYIPVPQDSLLRKQLTARKYGRQETTGKFRLESKDEMRARCKFSPDRADAFVLCYFTYRPPIRATVVKVQPTLQRSIEQLRELIEWNPEALRRKRHENQRNRPCQRFNYI